MIELIIKVCGFDMNELICVYTGLRHHNRIVFEKMSSWTALAMHLEMKTAFYTKYI